MAWCLKKEYADKFRQAIASGAITPEKLLSLTSTEARRSFLEQYVGAQNVQQVNTLLESKFLLKNQQRGIITWAKRTMYGPKKPADLIAKVEKLDKAMNPQEMQGFLADIVEKRLGTRIAPETAKEITALARVARELHDPKKPLWQQSTDYLKARQTLQKQVRENSVPPILNTAAKVKALGIAGMFIQRAIKVGGDVSFVGRQAKAYIGTKEWNNAVSTIPNSLKNPNAIDDLEIDIMRDKYYEDIQKVRNSLGLTAFGTKVSEWEELYASKAIGKVPVLRTLERSNEVFINHLRYYRMSHIIDGYERSGYNITQDPKAMEALAETISAASGRGKWKGAKEFSTVLFGPKWMASRWQVYTNLFTKKGAAQKEAASALGRLAGTSAVILGLMAMVPPDLKDKLGMTVELDPRSPNFGSVKFGRTRFDMTGGMAQLITIATRIAMRSTKNPVTGKITRLNTGKYGETTSFDLLMNYFTYKTSPIASIVRDLLKGRDFEGRRLELDTEQGKKNVAKYLATEIFTPMLITDMIDAYNDSSDDILAERIAKASAAGAGSFVGVSVMTYNRR